MREINFAQGSPEWKAHRKTTRNASDYPSAQGLSKKFSRSALVAERATGIEREFSAYVEDKILPNGHRVEALARQFAIEIIGEDLFPLVATTDDGYLGASTDGATMCCDIGWECKQWNEELATSVAQGIVPKTHSGQLDQQVAVFGFKKILFMVTDGTREKCVHCWYVPTKEALDAIRPTWEQLDEDVNNYQHVEKKPEAVGVAPDSLPVLRIEVTGMVTQSNLEQFKASALSVFRGINTSLQTDQDFADAEKAVKFCKDAEEKLESAKQQALSQTETIANLFSTIDGIKEEARTVRLKLEKLVKAEKENRKFEIVNNANTELTKHITALQSRIGFAFSFAHVSFSEAIKGLKSLDSMRDKVSVALANAKIEANAIADRIEANHKTVEDMSLFPDFPQICMKMPEDFAALMAMRVAQRKEAEERKLEAERKRIQAEEEAKARAKFAAEQAEANRLAAEAQAKAQQAERERVAAELAAKRAAEVEPVAKPVVTAEITLIRPVATSDAKQLNLGEISSALGFTVTAEFMAHLGLHPSATNKAAKLYAVTIATVCRLIQEHLARVMKESLAA